jgi:NAD(P)-dependent dehydrogenase (short-subunit alcohol dehydrogenase family)
VFAAAGASVCVIGRSAEHTQRTVDLIAAAGGVAHALVGDASDSATCERLVAEAVERCGRLDVLVNNLGLLAGTNVLDTDEETWKRVISVNLLSPIAMVRAAAPHFRRAGGGAIVNVSAIAGLQSSDCAPYGTTKSALLGLTRDMAAGLGQFGVRANCVVPGHLYTPIAMTNRGRRELRKGLSMHGVEGTGWDLAWAVLFLASDEARYINAVALPIDGGVTQQLAQSAISRLGLS